MERIYDQFGFDEEGYNSEGYDRLGYDREGYDKDGYNKKGINREGFNKLTHRDKEGYDVRGYDLNGYDREGFDKEGFDEAGYGKDGFNREGFSQAGFDREGYDKKGFNNYGFDREGYDRKGFNAAGFDREGYDHDGYDKEGYDREGYDVDGYNRSGYNSKGYDKSGYNSEGYDEDGYNRYGYGKDGYNREGYDKMGYNRDGYDKEGYDRLGYDQLGYDRAGYNKSGYDREGYDREGFNRNGYDKEGYKRDGFNAVGYNRAGFDMQGFDKYGYDVEGFGLDGYNKAGYNIFGYNRFGFNIEGVSLDGFEQEDFDAEGYNLYTGYNLKGFNREGYNINGIDSDGYTQQGYHFVTGLDREGFDVEGYNINGFNKKGYDRDGFDQRGFDRHGYDREGFNSSGYNQAGFDRDGFDKYGYDAAGLDRKGKEKPKPKPILKEGVAVRHTKYGPGEVALIQPDRKHVEIYFNELHDWRVISIGELDKTLFFDVKDYLKINKKKFDGEEEINYSEQEHFDKFSNYVRTQVKRDEEIKALAEFKPQTIQKVDRFGGVTFEQQKPDYRFIERMARNKVRSLLDTSYFCHILYRQNENLYIGKQAIDGWVVDWADEKASLYYQRQVYIGLPEYNLEFVRDIDIKFAEYLGYVDLYNRHAKGSRDVTTDKRLKQIIAANRSNKRIHDIVESIQKNQYDIITTDKSRDLIVLGCAGSGKTMIMMHKIRFMKYNNPNLSMDDVIVISPTDILGKEGKELSKLLQIDKINQFSIDAFYESKLFVLLEKMKQPKYPIQVIGNIHYDENEYEAKNLLEFYENVKKLLNPKSPDGKEFLVEKEKSRIELAMETIRDNLQFASGFERLYKEYEIAKKELEKTSIQDIEQCIVSIQNELDMNEQNKNNRNLLQFLLDTECFGEGDGKAHSPEGLMFAVSRLAKNVDWGSLKYYLKKTRLKVQGSSRVVQVMALFTLEYVDKESLKETIVSLNKYSLSEAKDYLKKLDMKLSNYDVLEKRKNLLTKLKEGGMFESRDGERTLSESIVLEKGRRIASFFEYVSNVGSSTDEVIYYLEKYGVLEEQLSRLNKQIRNGGNSYLYDALLSILSIDSSDGSICLGGTELLKILYVMSKYSGPINRDKKYIYIDEFQDFAYSEIELISNLYPNATVNMFGDVNQCINKKGINARSKVDDFSGYVVFEVKENYRNAKAIAEYVKDEFQIDMLPVGLPGSVRKSKSLMALEVAADDRIAIIVGDEVEEIDYGSIPRAKVNLYVQTGEIKRNLYNVLPISMAKGLEFEKVEVLATTLNKNERYVACTRAIDELVVVE
ncbi:MAG: hypothetical protein ACI39H_00395 [Lachnospiraceae bacterium]